MYIEMKSPFEISLFSARAPTVIGTVGRLTGATALAVAVALAFTAATPTPASADTCLTNLFGDSGASAAAFAFAHFCTSGN